MSSLERIYLYDNWLSKSIPSEIGLLSNLVDFVAHTNAMTGQLPSSLAKCSLLELLILNANKVCIINAVLYTLEDNYWMILLPEGLYFNA